MTGPLAQQFAQVREESALLADWAEEPLGMGSVDVDNVRGRLLEALSAIERHVQDMEKALEAARELNDCAKRDLPEWYADDGPDSLAEYEYFIRLDEALAALPASGTRNPRNRVAREKGTE